MPGAGPHEMQKEKQRHPSGLVWASPLEPPTALTMSDRPEGPNLSLKL